MTLTPPQSLLLAVMIIAAAYLILPGCGILGEPGRTTFWDIRDHTGH